MTLRDKVVIKIGDRQVLRQAWLQFALRYYRLFLRRHHAVTVCVHNAAINFICNKASTMIKSIFTVVLGSMLTLGSVSVAMAQNVPGHPHVNELDQRLMNQQRRIDAGANQGQIGARGEARDQALDARVAGQLSRDEARNRGHVTGGEYRQLNRELNANSRRIYAQRHG